MAGATALPAYALPIDGQRVGETKAILSLGFSILSLLITLFFFPLAGLVLAIAGLVLGTLSRSSTKRGVSTAGIIFVDTGHCVFSWEPSLTKPITILSMVSKLVRRPRLLAQLLVS